MTTIHRPLASVAHYQRWLDRVLGHVPREGSRVVHYVTAAGCDWVVAAIEDGAGLGIRPRYVLARLARRLRKNEKELTMIRRCRRAPTDRVTAGTPAPAPRPV